MTTHTSAVFCLLCTAVLVWAEVNDRRWVRMVSKALAAGSFIDYALAMGALDAGAPRYWVFAALVLSALGDLCLLRTEEGFFLAGIGAFLLGHLAYIGAFVTLGVSWLGIMLSGVVVAFLAALIWRWVSPHTGSLTRAVAAYVVVISVMVTMAVGSAFFAQSAGRLALLVAAIGFFLSDICVARDRFIAPGADNRVVGLPLYFGSQLIFAGSIALAEG